ncbi:MAG: trans-2-enoyl-CoA reductase family protein [Spirochaetaceae bacterium]|jgi:enoyl-[acyl-carrier protein] reductase/trans-2-enoyl-CoA reductase (NAD+)|nr:trans-2-enoyl-CoA reductase family protein [Spirochaetaceae bacterium]
MILKPMIRNNICLNCHPGGCAKVVRGEIDYARKALAGKAVEGAPKLVLVIGCSTGYGLASRVVSAFGYGAATVGISFEKAASATKTGTPGWYNNAAFNAEAAAAGLPYKTLDGDAFSDGMKARAVQAIRETAAEAGVPAQADLVVYSLASPVRTDPKDGVMYKSVIKPVGEAYSGITADMLTGKLSEARAEPATAGEIAATIKVMGGEDWELWIDALDREGVLSPNARTVAYTYIGPELSWAIYKNGTIGRAKEDLERAGKAINAKFLAGGNTARRAWVSVNKALVTRASAVIPIIHFYVSCLFKVMKEKGLHEGCVEQIARLFKDRLYTAGASGDPAKVPVDGEGRIRIDDLEMREDVQKETIERMKKATEANIFEVSDIAGFKHDFLEAHGFDVPGINYDEDADPLGI